MHGDNTVHIFHINHKAFPSNRTFQGLSVKPFFAAFGISLQNYLHIFIIINFIPVHGSQIAIS